LFIDPHIGELNSADRRRQARGLEIDDDDVELYDSKGKLLYQNSNAIFLGGPFDLNEKWQLVSRNNHRVRLLTLQLPNRSRTLQVGLVIDPDFLRWQLINVRIVLYEAVIIFFLLILAYFLSGFLLKPITNLASYLQYLTEKVDTGKISEIETTTLKTRSNPKEEFDKLKQAIQKLVVIIQKNLNSSHLKMAQFAHELKTPLTVLQNKIEKSFESHPEQKLQLITEIGNLSLLIQNYTEWALVENTPATHDGIYAVKVKKTLQDIILRLESLHPHRLNLQANEEFTVFCKPVHLEQVLLNLILNSIKYSPQNSRINLVLSKNTFSIQDQGKGLPKKVIENLGSPFNAIEQPGLPKGTGLGLAWVIAICKRYEWHLQIPQASVGTLIQIDFPTENDKA
jgi:signal transduction histidine kinase